MARALRLRTSQRKRLVRVSWQTCSLSCSDGCVLATTRQAAACVLLVLFLSWTAGPALAELLASYRSDSEKVNESMGEVFPH